jgi:uncharacterized protein
MVAGLFSQDATPVTIDSEVPWEGLPERVLRLWRVQAGAGLGLMAVVVASLLGGGIFPSGWTIWVGLVVVVLLVVDVVDVAILVPVRHRWYRFAVTDTAVRVRTGRIYRTDLTVPRDKILYVELRQGPLARHLGLVSLRLGTISEGHDIGPVTVTRAAQLKQLLDRPVTDAGRVDEPQ